MSAQAGMSAKEFNGQVEELFRVFPQANDPFGINVWLIAGQILQKLLDLISGTAGICEYKDEILVKIDESVDLLDLFLFFR